MKKFSLKSIIVAAVALVGLFGTFMPWVTVNVLGVKASAAGSEGDGWLTLIAFLAIIGISCAFIVKEDIHLYGKIGISILGAIIALIAGFKIADAGSIPYASASFGLFYTLIFGVLAGAAPWVPIKKMLGK